MKTIIAGTQQFIRFLFELSPNWDDMQVYAQFCQDGEAYNVLINNNIAYLPSEIGPGKCTLLISGSNGTKKGITNAIELNIQENVLIVNAHNTQITRDLYDQMLNLVLHNAIDTEQIQDSLIEIMRQQLQEYIDSHELEVLMIPNGSIKYDHFNQDLKSAIGQISINQNSINSIQNSVSSMQPTLSQVNTNKANITALQNSISSISRTISGMDNTLEQITINTGNIGTLQTAITNMQPTLNQVGVNKTDISQLKSTMAGINNTISQISVNTANISSMQNTISDMQATIAQIDVTNMPEIQSLVGQVNNNTNNISSIQETIDELMYEPIKINSFTVSPNSAVKGQEITEYTFLYQFNEIPRTLTIDSISYTPEISGSQTISDTTTPIEQDISFTLQASDNGSGTHNPASVSKTVSITFMNYIYYGVYSSVDVLTEDIISHMNNRVLSNSKARTITINVSGQSQYLYYIIPGNIGDCIFTYGGFTGGFTMIGTVLHTNSYGYTEAYKVYRSDNPNLGNIKVVIS